jgi:hypothetical protein
MAPNPPDTPVSVRERTAAKDGRMKRSTIVGVLSIGLLAGAMSAVTFLPSLVNAQTTPTSTTSAADDANNNTNRSAPQAFRDALAPLVADGTLTPAQLDKVMEQLRSARQERGRRERIRAEHPLVAKYLDTAAATLGVTPVELLAELKSGMTIAEVASAKGVAVSSVIDALVAQATAEIDAQVAEGTLTADEASTIRAKLIDVATAMVNGQRPEPGNFAGPFGQRRGGPFGHHHTGSHDGGN